MHLMGTYISHRIKKLGFAEEILSIVTAFFTKLKTKILKNYRIHICKYATTYKSENDLQENSATFKYLYTKITNIRGKKVPHSISLSKLNFVEVNTPIQSILPSSNTHGLTQESLQK